MKTVLLSMCLVAAGCAPDEVIINDQSVRISTLEYRVEMNEQSIHAGELALANEISERLLLQAQIDGVQVQLDEQGVRVYKCNAPTSSERIFKINGKFYATMNRVSGGKVIVAMDILKDGNYGTTDGGPACYFSISAGGTMSSNLVAIQ